MSSNFKTSAFTTQYAEELMLRIDMTKIVTRVCDHVLAEPDLESQKLMTDGQVRAALALINKVLPEAPKRVEHNVGGTLADLIAASFDVEVSNEEL